MTDEHDPYYRPATPARSSDDADTDRWVSSEETPWWSRTEEQPTSDGGWSGTGEQPVADAGSAPLGGAAGPRGPAFAYPPGTQSGQTWADSPTQTYPWASSIDTTGAARTSGRGRGTPTLAMIALVAVLAGLVGGGIGVLAAGRSDRSSVIDASASLGTVPTGSAPAPAPGSVADIASRVTPSVVSIDVRTASEEGTGSGFVIDPAGYILTNNHVVAAAADTGGELTVSLPNGKDVPGKIVGRDPTSDLAVVKVDNVTGLQALPLGNSNAINVGDPVIAVGSPLGLTGTVTTGIISAKDRQVSADGQGANTRAVISALQTDAAINPGNSGGPLVNMRGEVVGINSAIATLGSGSGGQSGSIGLGFAIPVNQARSIAEEIIRTGRATHPVIGVSACTAGTISCSSSATSGAAVRELAPGGGAQAAGLQPGDVITKVNDTTVDTVDDLIVAVRQHQIGDQVSLTYLRNGNTETTTVTLGSDQ